IEGNDEHTFTRECKFIIGNCDAHGRRNPKLLLHLNFLKQFLQLHNSMRIVMRSRSAGNNGRLLQARDFRSADFVPRMISEDYAFRLFKPIHGSGSYWRRQKREAAADAAIAAADAA
ncbi:hypothetical protein EV175_007402, partial [Coemansia sp. RSA 1933]